MGKKLVNQKDIIGMIIPIISKRIRKEMLMRDITNKELALKLNMQESYTSGILSSRPTNNAEVYRKIALAIGLTNTQFDQMVEEAQTEAFSGGEPDFDYALSSDLGNNPDAIKEVQGFMDFVKQKYGIKK